MTPGEMKMREALEWIAGNPELAKTSEGWIDRWTLRKLLQSCRRVAIDALEKANESEAK